MYREDLMSIVYIIMRNKVTVNQIKPLMLSPGTRER